MNNALVIGGSSGIGLAIIDKLKKNNYFVINFSRRICPRKEVESHKIDVVNKFEYEKLLFDICQKHKPCVLIYSAGYSMAAEIQKVRQKEYRYLFEINYFAALTAIRVASPFMKNSGGRIVVISSVASVMPIPYDPYYCASKSAIDTLCFCLRTELEMDKIYITSVLPGGTKTDFSFKRNIYNSKNKRLNNAVDKLYNIEQNGIRAEDVANEVLKVIKKKNPPIITGAGVGDKLAIFSSRILPQKLLNFVIKKLFYKNQI